MINKRYELVGEESVFELKQIFTLGLPIAVSLKSIEIFLIRYVQKKINGADLESIFELLECERSELEIGKESIISTILFEIATPEINGVFDVKKCEELLKENF
jgi:hypothetical protein